MYLPVLALPGLSTRGRAIGAFYRDTGAVLLTESDDIIGSVRRANGPAGPRLRSRGESPRVAVFFFAAL